MMMLEEVKAHLLNDIIPFWKNLRDDEFGGYYGYLDYDLKLDKKAEKGCILNSRITWFFSNAYTLLKDKSLLEEADHGYEFLKEHCIDKEYGGIYWSMKYDGTPLDTTKHTYNQAFCIYALSSYYEASGKQEALELARKLYELIETRCMDDNGYLEAFTRDFKPESNEKLSENGVLAEKTMNTLLQQSFSASKFSVRLPPRILCLQSSSVLSHPAIQQFIRRKNSRLIKAFFIFKRSNAIGLNKV